jgi:site-specific DNA-methyltransferase (adenine-specific)
LIIWARKYEKKPHKFNYETMKQLNGGSQMTDVWRIPAVGMWEKTCGKHPTQKALRLLYRIVLSSTDEGDTIFDPFAGSSTTGIAANLLGRKFIGIEQDNSFVELSKRRRALLEDPKEAQKLLKKMCETPEETTVLVNHSRPKDYELMLEKGMCYLRAGDSKGSLLVQKGFERLGYVLLHNNGENAQLFKLTKKGFQIWTAKALQDIGFSAENAPYYAVLRFDASKTIPYDQTPQLKQRAYTNVAKIRLISEFINIK